MPVDDVVVRPKEYTGALRNPLKGFTDRGFSENNRWSTLRHSYIRWNEIENDETDGIDKIQAWVDARWAGVEQDNVKVIPRVYLHWSSEDHKYWPADMATDDYSSPQFRQRVSRLVERLSLLWDRDARVAHVEMGLIGKWGEHHSPEPDESMQQLLGEAFTRAFPNRQVLVRHPWHFTDFEFGIYWDSWAHANQERHARGIAGLGDGWRTRLIGGEVAYNWGDFRIQPGDSPTDTVSDPIHRQHLIDTIRQLHCTQLRWVADYDDTDSAARAGAEEVQKAFGYRFVLSQAQYPSRVEPGADLTIRLSLRNAGSAPFYRNWPLEIALLDPETRVVVWRREAAEVDIREWMPGDVWDKATQTYTIPAPVMQESLSLSLPTDLPIGLYTLTLAILDPAGSLPSLRLAIENYYEGGRHPLGRIAVGCNATLAELAVTDFDDPGADRSLHYLAGVD